MQHKEDVDSNIDFNARFSLTSHPDRRSNQTGSNVESALRMASDGRELLCFGVLLCSVAAFIPCSVAPPPTSDVMELFCS